MYNQILRTNNRNESIISKENLHDTFSSFSFVDCSRTHSGEILNAKNVGQT